MIRDGLRFFDYELEQAFEYVALKRHEEWKQQYPLCVPSVEKVKVHITNRYEEDGAHLEMEIFYTLDGNRRVTSREVSIIVPAKEENLSFICGCLYQALRQEDDE